MLKLQPQAEADNTHGYRKNRIKGQFHQTISVLRILAIGFLALFCLLKAKLRIENNHLIKHQKWFSSLKLRLERKNYKGTIILTADSQHCKCQQKERTGEFHSPQNDAVKSFILKNFKLLKLVQFAFVL